jgi:hypothetical protein
VLQTIKNGAYSTFLVAQQAAKQMLAREPDESGHRGTIIFTNASAAMKGHPKSTAFAMACQAKAGLAQSLTRELMPQGIHVAQVPIDLGFRGGAPALDGKLVGPTISTWQPLAKMAGSSKPQHIHLRPIGLARYLVNSRHFCVTLGAAG